MSSAEPTDTELAEAWAAMRAAGRCAQHATLEAALASPVAGALVRMHARLTAQGLRPLTATRQRMPVIPPEPDEPFLPAEAPAVVPSWALPKPRKPRRSGKAPKPSVPTRQQPDQLQDRKRAAAGDRDDS